MYNKNKEPLKELYPGDLIRGDDILQFGESFLAIVLEVKVTPRYNHDPYAPYDSPAANYYVPDVMCKVYMMYDNGITCIINSNLQLLTNVNVLYTKGI